LDTPLFGDWSQSVLYVHVKNILDLDNRTVAKRGVLVNRENYSIQGIAWIMVTVMLLVISTQRGTLKKRPFMSDQPGQPPPAIQPDDRPFLFLVDLLALDLVNTEIVVRGKPKDLLATPADAASWWEAAQRHYPQVAVVRGKQDARLDFVVVHEKLIRLRTALRHIFSALVDGVAPASFDVDQLNTVLCTGYQAVEVTSSGDIHPVHRTSDHIGGILLPIALSAVAWFTTGDRQRLHRCANERCILLFYDTTKSATRRWCSTGCMDRARSAQRYQQVKQYGRAG
jgi:predicted RNA-binding Zn ribbon-like protein